MCWRSGVEQRLMIATRDEQSIEVHEGDWISIDGGAGEVYLGKLETRDPDFDSEEVELKTLLSWADSIRRWVCGQMPIIKGCRTCSPLWRRRCWSLPHRAHVLRNRASADRARDDHGARSGDVVAVFGETVADAAQTLKASSRRCGQP